MAEAICKRCIHHDICDAYTGEETITFFPYNEDCEHFKSKDDYAEVQRGKWIMRSNGHMYRPQCSVCGGVAVSACAGTLYCPNCGAEMVGKGEG